MSRLLGRRALVTGAGIGIGREVALELARQGADVVLSYHHSGAGAESAVAEIEEMGRRAHTLAADLGRVSECERLVDAAVEFLGGLDILVNNAGVTITKPFDEVTPEDFDALYGLNIRGQFFCAQRALPALRTTAAGHSVIVNMLSIHAVAGYPLHSLYAGTKGAIMAWTRTLAAELAPEHVRVVGVAPGSIEVPRFFDRPNYTSEEQGARIPWGRVGAPADVARVVAFLASDDAEFIVGETVVVDGGTMALMSLCR